MVTWYGGVACVQVEAQKLALAREKRAIEGQMMTLSKEVSNHA